MAQRVGKGGKVVIGSSNALHEVVSWQLAEKGDQVDVTSMQDNAAAGTAAPRVFLDALSEWSGQIVMNYDPTDAAGQETLVANLATTLKLYPEGDNVGLKYWSGSVFVTDVAVKSAVDQKIETTMSFKGTGALTRATA